MKTKTTDGKTVVVATEQDRRTLDRAIDVLIEYKVRVIGGLDARSAVSEAIDILRDVVHELTPDDDDPCRSIPGKASDGKSDKKQGAEKPPAK